VADAILDVSDRDVSDKEAGELAAFLKQCRARIHFEARALGPYLRFQTRIGKVVTQEEVAEAVGISRQWYALLESGSRRIRVSPPVLGRIAEALMLNSAERSALFQLAVPELGVTKMKVQADDADGSTLRTRNFDEALEAVTKIYCPHSVKVVGRVSGIDAFLKVTHFTSQPLVELSYSTPVTIATQMSDLFLMMHCETGASCASQERRTSEWKAGQTMPLSANVDTKLCFDQAFSQKSVRVDVDRLEAQCARWLGHPLEEPLRFDLRPFSDELEQIWQRTLAYGWSREAVGMPLADAAKAALDEYLLTLLLHHHPHNYSEELACSLERAVSRRR
jgi:transcriptional regulator with XRE-family HTH domain